jgi:hypothetical protein
MGYTGEDTSTMNCRRQIFSAQAVFSQRILPINKLRQEELQNICSSRKVNLGHRFQQSRGMSELEKVMDRLRFNEFRAYP